MLVTGADLDHEGLAESTYISGESHAESSASEFQREFDRLRIVAHREAVIVTSHGRDDVVLLSVEEYYRLRGLDRRAMHVSELTDEEITALGAVMPAEAARYNHEV